MKYQYLDRAPTNSLIPAGDYTMRIKGGEFMLSKAGNEMLVVELHNAEHDSTIWDNLVFTDKALWKIDQFLKSFGMQPDKGEEFEFDAEFVNRLIGKSGLVKVRVDEWEGKKKNKVEAYIAVLIDGKASSSTRSKKKSDDEIPF
jgi:hypothetical protein